MTTDETLQALTDGFTAIGIDTPQKVIAFVQIAALQVQQNTQTFQLQAIQSQQNAAMAAATAALRLALTETQTQITAALGA